MTLGPLLFTHAASALGAPWGLATRPAEAALLSGVDVDVDTDPLMLIRYVYGRHGPAGPAGFHAQRRPEDSFDENVTADTVFGSRFRDSP